MTTAALSLPVLTSASMPSQSDRNYQELSDRDLAIQSANKDMMAFAEIYDRHHRRVYSICLRMLQNAHESEDLTQDIFIQLYRKICTYQGHAEFTTWLHRLTVNQVLMYFRKQKNKNGFRKLLFMDSTEIPDVPVAGTTNAKKMSVEHRIALEAAIKQLPKGYRNVLILHDIEGYEHEEVAKILGVSSGTSKSQLFKARLKMQMLLKKVVNPKIPSGT